MKTWNITRTQYKVSDFLNWSRNDELDLNPFFQRRPVWKVGAKSYLLDTIMRGLPVPAIILRDVPSDLKTFLSRREVVDGQQRIRTVLSFVSIDLVKNPQETDRFAIAKSHNGEYAGLHFDDLPKEVRQRILDYQFMVHIFPSETDDKEILEVFARLNATGYKLNSQELRNAQYYGEFKSACYSLAAEQLERWRSWSLFTDMQIARMAEVETTSECLILIMSGISQGNKATIDRYYKNNDAEFPGGNEVKKRFRFVMNQIDDHFLDRNLEPFSRKTLFYALFAAIYNCAFGLESPLKPLRGRVLAKSEVDSFSRKALSVLDGTSPDEIKKITSGQVTNVGVRRQLAAFLLGSKA